MEILIAEPFRFTPEPVLGHIVREPGLHVTGILSEIETGLGLGPQSLLDPIDLQLYAESGHMWEMVMDEQFRRRMLRRLGLSSTGLITQLRLTRDFIHLTPDGLWVYEWVLLELKFLWRSPNCMDEAYRMKRMWKIIHQLRAYCSAISQIFGQPLLDVELIIGWVVGRYASKAQGGYIHPHPMRYRIRFSPEELRQTWEMILNHAYRHHPEWVDLLRNRKDLTDGRR